MKLIVKIRSIFLIMICVLLFLLFIFMLLFGDVQNFCSVLLDFESTICFLHKCFSILKFYFLFVWNCLLVCNPITCLFLALLFLILKYTHLDLIRCATLLGILLLFDNYYNKRPFDTFFPIFLMFSFLPMFFLSSIFIPFLHNKIIEFKTHNYEFKLV